MLQRLWAQLERSNLSNQAFIMINPDQEHNVIEQLGVKIPLLYDQEGKGTYPAIVMAAAYLSSSGVADPGETIIVLPADLCVDDSFFNELKELPSVLERSAAKISLIGTIPAHPSDQYGYIVPYKKRSPFQAGTDYEEVNRYFEKPPVKIAAELIEEGAYWNCGVFAFRLQYMLDHILEKGLTMNADLINRYFDKVEEMSFDLEVVKNEANVVVVPYEGMWNDLGSWATFIK